MNRDAHRLSEDLPQNIDLVVGIPRSGLLAANLLCLYMDIPMTDVDSIFEQKIFDAGDRLKNKNNFDSFDSVLIIDDSVLSGSQMQKTRKRFRQHEFPFDVKFGAIYISPRGRQYVDYWSEIVSSPRVFEWNVFHHPKLRDFCVDIDGVLCREPTSKESDNTNNYRDFLTTVKPNIVPNHRIGWLVTSREKKYRPETEAWLDEHSIEYDKLIMSDEPDMRTPRERADHIEHKVDLYNATDSDLFIESSRNQAVKICKESNKPVFCYNTKEMLQPGLARRSQQTFEQSVSSIKEEPFMFLARTAYEFSSRCWYWILSKLNCVDN